MARYIDADVFLKKIEKYSLNNGTALGKHSGVADEIIEVLMAEPTADVVPKSEEGAECPTCHGTGRIGTTDWLTKNISKKQLAEEKAKAIAEHEQHIKAEVVREIFEEIDDLHKRYCVTTYGGHYYSMAMNEEYAELKKKYTEGTK